jgi:hypothetical protein
MFSRIVSALGFTGFNETPLRSASSPSVGCVIESMESRRLLSATILHTGATEVEDRAPREVEVHEVHRTETETHRETRSTSAKPSAITATTTRKHDANEKTERSEKNEKPEPSEKPEVEKPEVDKPDSNS